MQDRQVEAMGDISTPPTTRLMSPKGPQALHSLPVNIASLPVTPLVVVAGSEEGEEAWSEGVRQTSRQTGRQIRFGAAARGTPPSPSPGSAYHHQQAMQDGDDVPVLVGMNPAMSGSEAKRPASSGSERKTRRSVKPSPKASALSRGTDGSLSSCSLMLARERRVRLTQFAWRRGGYRATNVVTGGAMTGRRDGARARGGMRAAEPGHGEERGREARPPGRGEDAPPPSPTGGG